MFDMPLPHPDLTWEDLDPMVGELVDGHPIEDAVADVVTLVCAMQAGEPVHPDVLETILSLADLHLDDPDVEAVATTFVSSMQAAGLLSVIPEAGARLGALAPDGWQHAFRYRDLVRLEALRRLWRLETDISRLQEGSANW